MDDSALNRFLGRILMSLEFPDMTMNDHYQTFISFFLFLFLVYFDVFIFLVE